jgi:outer membrane murein-binding lipoprotein Lpp
MMKLGLAALAMGATGASAALSLSQTNKERPIARIVRLLEDMKSQLETEGANDAEVYKELTCWCNTNRDEKTAAIALAEKTIANLEAELGEDAAKMAELKEKVKNGRVENRKNQKALDEATELRFKERKAFHEEEKDALATIEACKQAIVVLSKHHPELAQLKAVAKTLLSTKVVSESRSRSTIDGIVALKGFLKSVTEESTTSLLQIPGFQSYAPQSGQVFGMLKQMKETFEGNLSDTQKDEMDKRAAYQELKAAKEAELKAGRTNVANMQESLAAYKEKYAQAEEARANTIAQLKIDQEFLANLNEKCAQTDADYQARTKSRNEEISAVADTIAILNADDSFDQFGKTVDSASTDTNFAGTSVGSSEGVLSFIQVSAAVQNKRLSEKAIALLERTALKSKNPKIAMIATYAKLDAFTKVKKAIADMIAELKVQQKDEVDHRDYCNEEFNKNQLEAESERDNYDNLVAKIGDLTATITTLSSEIDTLGKEIEEMTKQAHRASDDRAKENSEFQVELKDQRITQAILNKAIDRMSAKFGFLQGPGAAHMNVGQKVLDPSDPGAGPAKFKEYGLHSGGAKVINLLTEVLNDSKKTENTLLVSEKDAQVAYESFMKDTSKSIDIKQQAIIAKSEEKANAEQDKVDSESAKSTSVAMLGELSDYKGQLHTSCDFLLKNFDGRQQARDEEMQALKQATAILSGMK